MGRKVTYEMIYSIIGRIPKGKVTTYGQIARLAGIAGHARQVGYALHVLPEKSAVPWHRVINASGRISLRSPGGLMQRMLLEKEGIVFDSDNRISFERYGWLPGDQSVYKFEINPAGDLE